jgi:hypothetical protein
MAGTSLLVTDAESVLLSLGRALTPQWGIYYNGIPVVAASAANLLGFGSIINTLNTLTSLVGVTIEDDFSIVDFSYKQDWAIATYPVEDGGFQSYDKVQLPFDVRMRVAAGGPAANRQSLIDILADSSNSLKLYDAVTPEQVYPSCNIVHVDYARKSHEGLGLLVADVWLQEVRVTSAAFFANTQQPGSAGQVSTGNVSPSVFEGGASPIQFL